MLKKVANEFVYGGHLLSIGAAAIVLSVSLLSGQKVSPVLLLIAYLISQIVYSYDHLRGINKEDSETNAERVAYLKNKKQLKYFELGGYFVVMFAAFLLSTFGVALLSLIIVTAGTFYSLKGKKFTKVIVGFKSLYVAFFWASLVFLVPLQFGLDPAGATFLFIFIYIFIRWIINSAFFDIKDIADDKKNELKTLPVHFGAQKTIMILHGANLLSAVALVASVYLEVLPAFSLSLLLFVLYSFVYLYKSKSLDDKQIRILSYVMVDGEYLFWPVVLLIAASI